MLRAQNMVRLTQHPVKCLPPGFLHEADSTEMLAAVFTLPDVATVVIVGVPLFLKPALIERVRAAGGNLQAPAGGGRKAGAGDSLAAGNQSDAPRAGAGMGQKPSP